MQQIAYVFMSFLVWKFEGGTFILKHLLDQAFWWIDFLSDILDELLLWKVYTSNFFNICKQFLKFSDFGYFVLSFVFVTLVTQFAEFLHSC